MEAASDGMESRNSFSAIGIEKRLKKKKKKLWKTVWKRLKNLNIVQNPTTMILGT